MLREIYSHVQFQSYYENLNTHLIHYYKYAYYLEAFLWTVFTEISYNNDVFVSKCIQFSELFHGENVELRFPMKYLTRTRHSVSMNGSTLPIQEYKSRLTATMAKYIDSYTMIMSLTCFIVPQIVNLATGRVPRL